MTNRKLNKKDLNNCYTALGELINKGEDTLEHLAMLKQTGIKIKKDNNISKTIISLKKTRTKIEGLFR